MIAALLIAFFAFLALAALCPGPSDPPVKTAGCRCGYCHWYLHPRPYCRDPRVRPRYLHPRWSFQSVEEMVEAWKDPMTKDLVSRSLAKLNEEHEQSTISELMNMKPMTGPSGKIEFYRP